MLVALALHDFADLAFLPLASEEAAVGVGGVGVQRDGDTPASGYPQEPEVGPIGQDVDHGQEGDDYEIAEKVAVEPADLSDPVARTLIGIRLLIRTARGAISAGVHRVAPPLLSCAMAGLAAGFHPKDFPGAKKVPAIRTSA